MIRRLSMTRQRRSPAAGVRGLKLCLETFSGKSVILRRPNERYRFALPLGKNKNGAEVICAVLLAESVKAGACYSRS